jgi:hypothetical protein
MIRYESAGAAAAAAGAADGGRADGGADGLGLGSGTAAAIGVSVRAGGGTDLTSNAAVDAADMDRGSADALAFTSMRPVTAEGDGEAVVAAAVTRGREPSTADALDSFDAALLAI